VESSLHSTQLLSNFCTVAIRGLHITLLSICECRENQRGDSGTFLMGEYGITYTMYRGNVWRFESEERLAKICVLCN
jgi:hypothetical protein